MRLDDESEKKVLRIAQTITGDFNPDESVLHSIRLTIPKPPTEGFLFAKEAAELIRILRSDDTDSVKDSKMRGIGEVVYKNHGFETMQAIAMEVRWQFPDGEPVYVEGEDDFNEGWHPKIIDFAWDGIGPWRP